MHCRYKVLHQYNYNIVGYGYITSGSVVKGNYAIVKKAVKKAVKNLRRVS